MSLFAAHFERQVRDSCHDDLLTRPCSFGARRPPGLALDAHATGRTALVERDALGADERLRADPRACAPREPDPERRLAELDREADDDRNDSPARRQDEQSQRDGDDEGDLIDD
jgi:hypothetical protein